MPKTRGNTSKKVEVKIEKKKRISQLKDNVVIENKADAEKVEREKKLFMWIGVSCIMVVFIVIWIFNLKYQFKINSNNNSKSSFNWEQAKTELDKAMSQVKQGIAEVKQIRQTAEQNTLPKEPELTEERINLLKGKLMNEAASSTATSTLNNKSEIRNPKF